MDRHGFFSHFCVPCGNGEETENLLEGLMRRRGKTFTSVKLFGIYKGAVLACKTSKEKIQHAMVLETDFPVFMYFGGVSLLAEKTSKPKYCTEITDPLGVWVLICFW